MERKRAEEILRRGRGRRIAVLGDLMLDRYVEGTVARISPEAPVPVVCVRCERAVPGGAANVALNVRTLGGRAAVIGAAGRDAAGEEILACLRARGIDTRGVVRPRNAATTVKTRVLAERQQVVRVDREDDGLGAAAGGFLAARLRGLLKGADGLLIEDYGKGVVSQPVVDAALRAARAAGMPVGLDPKNMELRFRGLALATPNYREACAAAGVEPGDVAADLARGGRMARIARRLTERWDAEQLLITLGAHGMYIVVRGRRPVHLPTRAREVFDVSGAGDTVIAAAMLALVSGADPIEAAALANHAAGVVVGKLGTAACSPAELLDAMERA